MKLSKRTSAVILFALTIATIVGLQAVRNLWPESEQSTKQASPPKKQKWGEIGALPNEWFYQQRAYPSTLVDPVQRLQCRPETPDTTKLPSFDPSSSSG